MIRPSLFFLLFAVTCVISARAGVSIHYEGTAASPNDVAKILAVVAGEAKKNGWKVEDASAEREKIGRVIDEKAKDYEGKITGVVIRIDENCEPLYFQFGDDLFMQDFVKTQFAGANTHIQIIQLLESIRPFFKKLEVEDEGEYWESHDKALLERNIQEVNAMMEAIKKKNPNAQGPVRLPSGRMADVVQ